MARYHNPEQFCYTEINRLEDEYVDVANDYCMADWQADEARQEWLDAIQAEIRRYLPDWVYRIWQAACEFEQESIWPEKYRVGCCQEINGVRFGESPVHYAIIQNHLYKDGKAVAEISE